MRWKRGSVSAIGKGKAQFFHLMQPIQAKFTDAEEYKEAIMMASLWGMRGAASSQEEEKVINIYVCSVMSIDGEFKIGERYFTVMSESENGNIVEAEATTNPPVAPEASTAPPEAEDIENEEVQASIFDAFAIIPPGRVTDDLFDLQASGLTRARECIASRWVRGF